MMTEAEPAAPEPVQVMAYVLLPAVEMVTASDPEVDVWAVQLAEQAVALVEDQVKLEALLNNTDEVSAESETVAAGGVEPPPPQEVIKNIDAASKRLFFIVIIYTDFINFENFWSSPRSCLWWGTVKAFWSSLRSLQNKLKNLQAK